MSFFFFRVVRLISGSVLLFSGRYIRRDRKIRVFIFLVILFILSIFFIIFSLNLVRVILG